MRKVFSFVRIVLVIIFIVFVLFYFLLYFLQYKETQALQLEEAQKAANLRNIEPPSIEVNKVKIYAQDKRLNVHYTYNLSEPEPDPEKNRAIYIDAFITTMDNIKVSSNRRISVPGAHSEAKYFSIPIRNLELNEGQHQLKVAFQLVLQEGDRLEHEHSCLIDTYPYAHKQPKRYEITVDLSGGTVEPGVWDHHDNPITDLQWWIYIGDNFVKSSKLKRNSYIPPDVSFKIIALHSERVMVRLYDKDPFKRDDLVGSYRVRHPDRSMRKSVSGVKAGKVSGFDVGFEKRLFLVE